MKIEFKHPALQLLMFERWDKAFAYLHAMSQGLLGLQRSQALLDVVGDRKAVVAEIRETVDVLYADGTPPVGALALAWLMLTVDPRQPHTFWGVLPQLTVTLDVADLKFEDDAALRRRLRLWWEAAEGGFTSATVSIFSLAAIEHEDGADDEQPVRVPLAKRMTEPEIAKWFASPPAGPSLVVMPKAKASRLNSFNQSYKDLVDAAMPLVVVRDLQRMRAALHAEFPHATGAVDLILRDLRDDKPFRISPIVLVSQPGVGKSRLVRRLADLSSRQHVLRFDAASSTDAVGFSGSAKSWSNTEPCVPLRAIAQSKTANPIVLIDEVEKASGHAHGAGRLHDALLAYLDRETSARYRDQSLDAELDLSMVSYIATANTVEKLPSPLRDRFRIIKVPAPTLAHLPQLAASIMRDLETGDEARQGDAPLALDELANIGKAWAQAKFSMRALHKIVLATLEARDQFAMRH